MASGAPLKKTGNSVFSVPSFFSLNCWSGYQQRPNAAPRLPFRTPLKTTYAHDSNARCPPRKASDRQAQPNEQHTQQPLQITAFIFRTNAMQGKMARDTARKKRTLRHTKQRMLQQFITCTFASPSPFFSRAVATPDLRETRSPGSMFDTGMGTHSPPRHALTLVIGSGKGNRSRMRSVHATGDPAWSLSSLRSTWYQVLRSTTMKSCGWRNTKNVIKHYPFLP